MNATQRRRYEQRLQQAADLGHNIHFRLTPAAQQAICSCNWTARQTRFQNAFRRDTLMRAAIRLHCETVIKKHQETFIKDTEVPK